MKSYSGLILVIIVSIFLMSCSAERVNEEESAPDSKVLTLPDGFSYAGRNPEMGNPENLQLIMDWNERRSNLQHEVGDLIADTLTMYMADGTEWIIPRDTVVAHLGGRYEKMADQQVTMNAAIPIYYSDLDHEWIYSWVFTQIEFIDGQKTAHYFHEDYRIINGKIRMLYQFKRKPPIDN
jgi:hypothetical protein